MKETLALIGIVLILAGFFLVFISALAGKGKADIAVGGFIGFIPFGFATDKKLLLTVIVISAIMAIISFFLWFKH